MATGREERMQQRMRGAQRHQVQEASFDLFLPTEDTLGDATTAASPVEAEAPPQTSSPNAIRETPNATATRRPVSSSQGPAIPARSPRPVTARQSATRSPAAGTLLSARKTTATATTGRASQNEEEIGESPMDAPGSGQRRAVALSAAAKRTAALHGIVSGSDAVSPTPGPRRRPGSHEPAPSSTHRRRSPRLSSDAVDAVDELSPETNADMTAAAQPQQAAKEARAGKAGGMYSKLAHAKKNEALRRLSGEEAPDELSSPSFVGIDPGELTTTSVIPSSSPLARKSTVGTRSARTSNNPRRSTLSSLSSRSSRASQASQVLGVGATTPVAATNAPVATVASVPANTDDVRDELSPEQPSSQLPLIQPLSSPKKRKRTAEVPSSSPPLAPSSQNTRSQRKRRQQQLRLSPGAERVSEEEEEEDDLAEEIDEAEAARAIGRKRPRRSTIHEPSPELGSDLKTAGPATVPAAEKSPPAAASRRRRRQGLSEQSPSTQNQPRPSKARSSKPAASAPTPTKAAKSLQQKKKQQRTKKTKKSTEPEAEDDSNDETKGRRRRGRASGPPVPITVQRFTKSRQSKGADDADAGGDAIPYADRSGVNAVDVLAQICEDIVEQSLQKVHDAAAAAEEEGGANREVRRDLVVRRRALAAFQDELRTRLLEQAVALDASHALRKRVRAAHKEKLALREEILRIRAERDQVALRMDALRAHHQVEKAKQMHHVALSAAMHDIDLAVEQGRAAPPLTAAQQKTADLGNLELMVSRVAEQLCGSSSSSGGPWQSRPSYGGGTLRQIMDFNAFLERTAAVLEGRDRRPARVAAAA